MRISDWSPDVFSSDLFQLLISTGDHPPRSISPCRARFPRDRRNLHDLAPDRELRELHRGDRRFSGGCSLVRATRLSGAAMSEKPDYKDTVFLPKTDFPMKAGLAQKEPAILARWEEKIGRAHV